MKAIRALRQFSHYHAGNFDQFEERPVTGEIADALIGMELAEEIDVASNTSTEPPKKTSSKK